MLSRTADHMPTNAQGHLLERIKVIVYVLCCWLYLTKQSKTKMSSGEVDGWQREVKGSRESSENLSLIETPRASRSQTAEKAH